MITGLEKIIPSNIIGNNADIDYMFYQCKSLKKATIHDVIINSITDEFKMFCECSSLNEVVLILKLKI